LQRYKYKHSGEDSLLALLQNAFDNWNVYCTYILHFQFYL